MKHNFNFTRVYISKNNTQKTIFNLFFILIVIGFSASALLAQSKSRTELLKQKRIEKAQNLHAYRLKKTEKVFLTFEKSQILDRIAMGFWGFHPLFGGLKTGAGTQAGILFDPTNNLKHFRFSLKAVFSFRAYKVYQAMVGYEHKNFSFYGYARYQDSPQDDFYGIGSNSTEAGRSNFRWKDTNIAGMVSFRLHHNISTRIHFSYLDNKILSGADKKYPSTELLHQPSSTPGLANDADFLVGTLNFTIDTRNVTYPQNSAIKQTLSDDPLRHRAFNPSKGTYLSIQASRFKDQTNGQFDFNRLDFEFQQYIPFYIGHQVIAFRHYASLVETDNNADVPFYLMQQLGGSNSLRSYREFRFRDRNLLLFNMEYRWQIWTGLDMALFLDAGKVFSKAENYSLKNLKKSYGIGFRFNTFRSVLLRLDIGHGQSGTLIHLQFNNVF